MKNLTKHFYSTIKSIEYESSELVTKVEPMIKKGQWFKFLGIPLFKAKHDIYSKIKLFDYCYFTPFNPKYEQLEPLDKYKIELIDDLIVIHRKAYIILDDKTFYFDNDDIFNKELSIIKGRCAECDNHVYKKTTLLD